MPKDRQHGRSRSRRRTKVNLEAMSGVINIQTGSIFWLPPRAENQPNDRDLTEYNLVGGNYHDHPVVIYAVGNNKEQVLALIITSLGGRNLLERFPKPQSSQVRCLHLPICPATHPDLDVQLHLVNDLFLRSESYINIGKLVELKSHTLKTLHVGPRRLKQDSFENLQSRVRVRFTVPDGYSTMYTSGTPTKAPMVYSPNDYIISLQAQPQVRNANNSPGQRSYGAVAKAAIVKTPTPITPNRTVYQAEYREELLRSLNLSSDGLDSARTHASHPGGSRSPLHAARKPSDSTVGAPDQPKYVSTSSVIIGLAFVGACVFAVRKGWLS